DGRLPTRSDLAELVHTSQRDGYLGLDNVTAVDLLRLVGGDDALERPAEVIGQLDPVVLRGPIPEVLLQIQVPLVRRVEVQGHDDLARIDQAGKLLPDVPRRVQLVDFRHLSFWLRWLNRGDLGDLRKRRAVLGTIKFRPQTSGLSQFDPSYYLLVDHDDID